jgi:hypothetical protein
MHCGAALNVGPEYELAILVTHISIQGRSMYRFYTHARVRMHTIYLKNSTTNRLLLAYDLNKLIRHIRLGPRNMAQTDQKCPNQPETARSR